MTAVAPTPTGSRAQTEQALAESLVGRQLNRVERAMFTAMWSEHCSYKHSRILLAGLPTSGPRVVVGPGENAGALDLGDGLAVVFKVESHNHPSAVEPYQGAATGVGGIVRDVFTMAARPIALLNGLRFGPLTEADDPSGETDAAAAARNRWLFGGVVSGIAGYGNCLGIPDVGGELVFDPSYSGNPLVNAMCVGLAQTDALVRARAAEPGSALMLVGASTGRDGIQGAAFASATLGGDSAADRPAVQVGNPFLEKLLMEACLSLAGSPDLVAMQDLGAAGLTCALAEVSARGDCGAEVNLDRVPLREAGMDAHDILLSESQERMLLVVRQGAEDRIERAFAHYDLHATVIGRVIGEPIVRCRHGGDVVCELPPKALTDDAPQYRLAPTPPVDLAGRLEQRLDDLAGQPVTVDDLLGLLASPNLRSRRPVWRQYDHMNGTRTVVAPGADAALLRVDDRADALALALDGPGRQAELDPWVATASAVIEGALNVACCGAQPIGFTNCLNFGSPEEPVGAWQLAEAVAGMAAACRALDLPIVSGNVSLYNQTDAGAILPAPIIGTVGHLPDRTVRIGPAWRANDEVWLLGHPAAEPWSLASSELAVRRGVDGGRPQVDLGAAARLVALLPRLVADRVIVAAHDVSRGGLAVAAARMALASGVGARLSMPAGPWPTAAAYGESAGRVLVAASSGQDDHLGNLCRAAGVAAVRLGVAGGPELAIGGLTVDLPRLRAAWGVGF